MSVILTHQHKKASNGKLLGMKAIGIKMIGIKATDNKTLGNMA